MQPQQKKNRSKNVTMIPLAAHLLLFVIHTQAYKNLALLKPAWQMYNYPTKPIAWGAAKAVDGKYSDRSAGGNQCTISDGKETARLRINLQSVVSISHINIFYRTEGPGAFYDRFAGFFLYVSNTTSKDDGYLCFHEIQNMVNTPTENQTISCPVHGRYVIYYNERRRDVKYPSYYSPLAYNEVCELEVYGCEDPRFYGEDCDRQCPENCQEKRCNITTGDCLGCLPGYQGLHCDKLCDKQTYGLECSLSCGNCSDGETCHHVNGTCLNGCNVGAEGEKCLNACHTGFYGKNCIHKCSENCGVTRRCNRFTGECQGGCQPGHYGMDCGYKCNENCKVTSRCNRFTGECEGGCQPGWRGIRCDKKCDGGLYGVYCNQTCGHCINDSQCHHINGTCLDGCSPGYDGSLCVHVCRRSNWGVNCKESCSRVCVNQTCHHVSGVCVLNAKSQKMCGTCNNDHTITIISVALSVLIVITGSVLNYLYWRRNQHNANHAKEIHSFGQKDHFQELSAVNIADQHSDGDKITSAYAELGALDKPNTYEELQHCKP